MHQVGIRAGSYQATHQRVFKHVAGPPGILTDDHPCRGIVSRLAFALAIVPPQKAAHLIRMVRRQVDIGLAAEAIGAKVFSHGIVSFSSPSSRRISRGKRMILIFSAKG